MNEQNPYAASAITHSPSETDDDRKKRLRNIAFAQRHVNYAVLLYFFVILTGIALPAITQNAPWTGIVVGVLATGLLLYGAVSIYRLAAILRGSVRGIITVLGFLVPLLGILLLLSVNREATNIFRRYNIKVGLLGADPNSI